MFEGFSSGSYQTVLAVSDPVVHVPAAWKCISAFGRNPGFVCNDAFACGSNSGSVGNRAHGNCVLAFAFVVFWPGAGSFGAGIVSGGNLFFPISGKSRGICMV